MAIAQAQTTFDLAYQAGLKAEQKGRWREALAAYQRAVDLYPKSGDRVVTYGLNMVEDYWPFQRMARCYVELGEWKAAEVMILRSAQMGEPDEGRSSLRGRLEALKAKASEVQGPPKFAVPLDEVPSASPIPREALEKPPGSDSIPTQAQPKGEALIATPTTLPSKSALPNVSRRGSETISREEVLLPEREKQASFGKPYIPTQLAGGWILLILVLAAFLAALVWRRRRRQHRRSTQTGPEHFGPYLVQGLLGRGGFALTYKGVHEKTGLIVALKVPHAHILLDEDNLHRFEREAFLGVELSHPNLVKVLGTGMEGHQPFLVLEFVEGLSLDKQLQSKKVLAPVEAFRVAAELAEALAFAHAHQVIHRDLKPANVLLTEKGTRLLDLGIAKCVDDSRLTTTLSFLGTPQYAAPETLLGEPASTASDIYGLGAIVYEMLTGHPPHTGTSPVALVALHARGASPDPRALPEDLDPAASALVMTLLATDPAIRPNAERAMVGLRAVAHAMKGKRSETLPRS